MSDDAGRFAALKQRLPKLWIALANDPEFEHTSVIVPSLSVNQEELAKVTGAAHYEERLLFALDLLEVIPSRHVRERLHMMSVLDSSQRPLTEKVLERPRFLRRMQRLIGRTEHAYLTCYNSTALERRLAVALDLPLNGLDPDHLVYATKSGNRRVFAEAGVDFPAGSEDLFSEDDIIDALLDLGSRRPAAKSAVVKLNEGFGGEGNGVFDFPSSRNDRDAVRGALHKLRWTSGTETSKSFLRKFASMGGIVEEFFIAEEIRSPSVQMRVTPDGQTVVISSHEQVLGGATGQSYLGCRFPADDEYREALLKEAMKIGKVLATKGILGRFAIDFMVGRGKGGAWRLQAIEINLRMGGTTTPFLALESLTGGQLDAKTGLFIAPDGTKKYYSATDNLKSPAYRGLLPEDLFEVISRQQLGYRHSDGTGALFHMIGALSQYGKVGMTCIANSAEDAQALFERTTLALDDAIEGKGHGVQVPLLDRNFFME